MSTITKPQVPAGLRDLMKDLTREILKEKPTDIYDFAENYFSSRLPQKENYAVRSFENSSGKYDFSYIQNPQRYQVPVALVYSIIPEGLTNLIKELIKAVLREQPQNLCDFAVEYFRHIKAVTSTESQAEPKEINYSAYENYFMNKERFLFTPYVKCTCGRILGESYAHSNQIEHFSSIHNIQNNDSAFQSETLNTADTNSNNVSKMSENYSIYSEKYMNAIYIIQTYIRRYLKRKSTITKTKGISSNHHSLDLDSMTTKTEEMPIVPQLQINQNEAENNSEDVSYTSASTALLSATESGRETSEPSTSESILTKTIIEGVQMENDDKNISDYLKQSANGHAQIEATTNNQDVDDNRNANVPERNVEIQQIDKGATELMNNTAVSKNEELKSINETDENPLARNDLEGKSTLESQKLLKSNEHGSIDSVIVSSINTETFGNDHMDNLNDKELISKSEMGELPKKSGDIHYAEIDKLNKDLNKEKLFSESKLNSETEVITKESSLNLAKEANTILIHSTNNIKRLVNKSSESLDKKLSDEECTTNNKTIKTCHEIEQTNSNCGSADNISEKVDKFHIENINEISENEQKPILDKQKEDTIEGQDKSSKIEHRQSLDIQNVSIANENEGECKTSTEEQKQSIDRKKDSIENEAEHDKQKDSIMENNKSDLLEEIFKTKLDTNNKNSINKSTNDLNQCSLDSNMESNADDANISNKFKNQEINDKPEFLEKVSQINEHENKKLDVANSTQNKSVIETSEANKTTGNDKQDMNLQDTSQTEQHEENVTSANTDNVSEVEKDFEKPQTQANNSFNRNISSKLNNELIRPKINDDDENISAEVDTNDKIGAILASIPKDNADIPSSESKETFDKNETNTIEPKLETNLNNTQDSKENHDDSIKQDIANPNLLDNKNNAATIIGIKSEEITLEKSAEVDTNDTIGAILASNSKETKENFDKNEINTRTEMDKIIKEHKLEINLNNTQASKDNHDDAIKQDIANPNLLDNKNNAATIIGIKSEEITLEKSNETDTNLVKSSEVVSDKTKSCTSNFLEKQMDITHDKESGNEFEPKSEINEHLHEKGKDVETKHDIAVKEIETENKLEQTFKNELIEDMKTNNLNDTNIDIKLENQVDKSEHMSNVINEVIINKTVKDEMDLNQEETFQGDLNMKDNNTKNSIDEDLSLKSQSEKPLLDSNETTTTKDEMDNKLEEVSKTKLCEINKTSTDILQRNLDMNKENKSNETIYVGDEKTENDNQDTNVKDLHTIKDNSPSHESKHDEVDFKAFKSVKESNNLNDKVEVIHKTIQGIKLHESPTTMTLDEKNINTNALDDLKDDNQSIKSQSESERVKSLPIELNDKHETVDKNKHEASITENSIEPTANDKVAKNIQQSFQAVVHEKNNNSDNVELNTEQQLDNNLTIEVAVAGTAQKAVEEKTISINQTVDLTSENLSQKQQSESITSESAIEHTNEKTFQSKVESIENTAIIPHSDCNETNDVANALPDDNNNNVENSNDTLEVSNQTESQENIYKNVDIKSEIQLQPKDEFKQKSGQTEIKTNVTSESQDKDVGIKSEPQFESNDELKQNTNLPKTLQTDPIETSYIIDDLSINYEKDDIKTNEKHELDKPLNKTKDKIVINDDKEMSSTISEDKKDIKPKVESEISQTDVENLVKKSDKGDQNMNEPENLNTITKSNSLQKPLQMMLSESKNITVESVGKTIKQETVNDPDNSTKITDQDKILSKISKTELDTNDINPINANDNIAETTNKGDQEKIPQGSSINELNYSNIITDDAIDKTFTESQENTYKNVDIKSEVQPQSNDELKQNTNLPKTLQTEPIETSYIIDDLSINCETDDIKTNEKHELDKPLNKSNDKIVINDASEFKEMSSTILEDKKNIKPKVVSEILQTDAENLVQKTDKGQNMNEPENSITINKSNSLQEPLQMMLCESNNITGESVDKTIKQETVNDPDNSTKITDQDMILSKNYKTELETNDINPINANDNIAEPTKKGDQEKIPQGSSINELNYNNIITDDAIDKTFTLKSAESTDKEQVKQNLMDTLQTKFAENMNNLGTDDSITDTNLINTSGSGNVAQENGKNSSADDLIAKHDLNANTAEEHKQISDTKSDLDAVKESTTVRSTVNTAEELITESCVHETQMERHKQISDTKSDLDEVKESTTVRSAVKPNESDVKLNSNKHIKAETLDRIPSYTEVDTQYMDSNNIISKTPNKQPDQISEKSSNSDINSEKSSEEFTISEDRVKRETAIETSPTDTNEHDGNSTTEKLFSLSSNDSAQPQLEESRNGIQDKNLNDSHERDNKDKFENTEKKDIKEKHYEKSKSLSSENESERSFEKEFGTSKEEKSCSNVDSKNKLEIARQAEQNTATNESSGDIKNINTVYTKHQLAASNSSASAIENNDDGEIKMFADDLKEDIATSTGSEVSSQLSLTKQDTTCNYDAQKQSDIFEIKCTSTEETAPEKHLDGVDKGSNVSNSYSIQAKYEQIDTTNSADEAVGSDNKNQMHHSDPKLESKAKMTCVIETAEKLQSPKQLNLETQETGSDSNHDDKCSSKVLNELEITNKNVNDDENYLKKDNEVIQDISKHEESCEKLNEKTSISLNCNVVPIEAKQMENEVKNSNYNEIELNTNSEISSKNEQDNNNQHDRDNNTNEKMDKDSTTGSKNSEEFHNDSNSYNENAQHSNNNNKNDTNLENNEISLESEEAETRNYDGSNSEDKNDDKKSNQKLFTIQDEQISKFNENVNSNESKMIQQPDSITNSSILNNSKTLTHVLNKEIASEGEANPKDYQLKSSLVNSSDIENNISSTMLPSEPELSVIKSNVGSKTSDLHMNKLQPSIIEVQQQNSAQTNESVTIKLEDGETNANENTESSPLENKAKTEVSNPLVHIQHNISSTKSNEQETSDSSTTKHIEEIESSNTAINKLNVSNVGNIHEDLSYSSTKNEKTGTTNNDELHSSAEIVNIDSNPNIPNSEQLIKINNESNNNNITNKDTHISIDDQTPLAADESKNLNIIKDHSTLTSNELKGSVMGSELQDISNQSQVVADAPYINNNDSLTHSKSEGIICNETSLKETHSDDHNNMISDGNGITRSIDTLNETKLITKDKTMDTSSELNLSNHTANVETTIGNEIKHENFDQEITGQTNTDVKGEHTNEQDTTHNIGIQTPETFIGNQNFNIGRIRNFNEGLLGSISGQRFAETHLKSFWKEYVMNNSIPLSQYDYKENESKEQTMTGSVHEINKARLADTKNEEQIIDIVEPEILKENITQMESSPTNNHNIYRTSNDSNPPKDIERIPRYFYGVPDTVSNDKANHSNQKSYKEPTAFTINMGESNKVHTTKIATSIEEESSTKPNTEVVFIKDDKKLSLSKLNLVECADVEPLLDAETPTKLFQDLHEFEYNIHDVDLDITYTIDEIIRLRIENDSQHNSDNDEHLNEFSEYSLTPEPMLQTIIELSESETPKPPDLLHSIDDDFLANLEKISDTTSTSWTTGSKEDNSFISDEFLDEKHNGEYLKATPTNLNSGHETQGGIYEFAKDELVSKEIQSQNEQLQDYEHIIEQAPTPPNNDPFYEDLKETAAKSIQRAYRQYKQKRILKAVESIDTSENSVETPDKKYHKFHNIDNDANLTSHDEVNNTKCNELKDQASIENNILKKEEIVTVSINPVISQEKPTEIENYKETGENKIKQLVENSDDCGNESESISKEHRNNRSSIGSDRNEYINKTKSSSNNINSESKQESIVQEHLNVIILQKDLNSTEDDIDCSENKTHDLSKTVDETDSGTTMSNSNSEKQKFETINILPANCDINEPIEKIKDSISNITDANIKVNNKNSNDSESIETNVSENIRYINNMNQNSSNSETNTENQNNNKSNELLKSSNSSKIESINNEITNPNCNSITNTITSFDIKNDMKEESGEINETKHDLSIGHFYFKPTAPAKEDIQSVVSQENIKTNHIIQDQAARKIQRAFKHFIEQKSKLSSDLETKTESSKSNWFVGDEPIIANDSLTKTTSEISFEETEAYVELNNPSQYLVGSSSNLETIDANNFSRSPTAPVSNRSRNSVDLANNPSTNISKDTVSVIATGTGIIENTNTEHTKQEANTLMNEITSNGKHEEPSVAIHLEKQLAYKNEKAFKYTSIIDQFINVERHYSDVVNHHNKEIKFTSPNIAEITKILSDFTDSQKAQCDSEIPYERLEEPCIKKSASRPHNTSDSIRDVKVLTEAAVNTDTSSSSDIDDTEDSLSTKTVKLHKTEMAITKMQQRRDSTTKVSNLDKPKDYNFEEPLVAPMDNLDTDEEGIVINKLNREETRESSGQSDVDVIIGGDKDDNFYFLDNIDIDETFPSKGSLKRVHTIAGDGDAKSLLKNVTIDESIKYIEPPDYELNSGSLCLDDDTAENIRRKMMAYSLSEADSDCFDKTAANSDGTNPESKTQKYDDFNVSTALVENGDSSTETESTIVSAVTKIQAGARGYLTRKRLGKTSIASDGKSIPHDDINKVSFGNAAINESLEHLVQEAAAKRIQNVYRQHYRKKLAEANRKDDENLSPEFATSMENTLAQKRSMMLQRGDALRNDSTPDEGNSSSNGSGSENGKLNKNIKNEDKTLPSSDGGMNENATVKLSLDMDMVSTAKTAATIRAKKIEENKMRWLAMRQNSMPVQIDSEVLRVIPKYMRKKIKSAEGEKKKKDRRRMLID